MTDRINHLSVTLTHDIRDDDCESLIQAIRMLKGVLDVSPNVADIRDQIAFVRADSRWRDRIIKLLEETR